MPLFGNTTGLLPPTREPQIIDVVIYPVSEDITGTEITDTGSAPIFMPTSAHSTTANAEGSAAAAWTETIDFEQIGVISIISVYWEFEWQSRFVIGGGGGTTSSSKIQVSGDGGTTWTDLTDNYDNTSATMTTRIRAGVGNILTSLSSGTNQLSMRLVHWTNDGGSVATSEAQIRSNSYIRLTYRKS